MALQIRRGTDVDRQGITPKAGEPIFTTDTKKLYIGDGTTAGGIIVDTTSGISNVIEDTTPQLGGNLDLNNNTINGTGSINITGQISASSIDLKGSVFADDSTLLVDGISGTIPASNLTGSATIDITGDVVGDVAGNVVGDITGSVFADDSGIMVDAVNNEVHATRIFAREIKNDQDTLVLSRENDATGDQNIRINSKDGTAQLLLRRTSDSDLSGDGAIQYGGVVFQRDDSGGSLITSTIFSGEAALTLANNANGWSGVASESIAINNGDLGVGTFTPSEKLEVVGNAIINGTIQGTEILIDSNNITTTTSNSNLRLTGSGSGTIELGVPTQTTVGAAGAANALPATPSTYFKINVAGTEYVVPAYAVS